MLKVFQISLQTSKNRLKCEQKWLKTLVFELFSSFFEKSLQKVWWFQKYSVPLHPQIRNDAPVAQLVEHLTLNQGVQGSSPCGCTKSNKAMN